MNTNADFDPTPEGFENLFYLPASEGVNASERILTALCRKSFLRLWSQTNVFTDEGFRDGKGSTRELCDTLVIFGNDVILFSDKHVTFQSENRLTVAWPRWYRRAILESCKQLHGAKSWLQRFPHRAFLDAKCTRALPVPVPTSGSLRFHLVAVTRGSRDAALAYNNGEGLGSFRLNSALEGNAHSNAPFSVGIPEPEKAFVHVFDEVSIELLLTELDTAADFLNYLKKREALLGRRGTHVLSSGEEELLATYLRTMDSTGEEHVFFDVPPGARLPDVAFFVDGSYKVLSDAPAYQRKKIADKISYEWDRLIDRFVKYGDPRLHEQYLTQDPQDIEKGLRLMAAESRFNRRQLATAFVGALHRVEPGQRLGRLSYSGIADDAVYVFVVVPKQKIESYDEYRLHRIAILHAYVRTAKLMVPAGTTFVGIAFDNPNKDYNGSSEDLFVVSQENWTQDELSGLRTMRRDLGLWGNAMEWWRFNQDEFPEGGQYSALQRITPAFREDQTSRSARKKKTEKRRVKMQKTSKRRNRGMK
ncbi:hypothetical protein [Burkholderia cenocepacia]|uniref:hypothetical protein n=1 Tax=Burkholderia cenocepacia TaxID=95486 RepID=UPI0026531894|nr:hypothetical protein [Burkholderia cenocepacia]MDN7454233.1 hypothetical protein [Burkholderia cenocepacia]